MYIPPGFGTVTPYLFAEDAERLIHFLIDAFGGVELCRSTRPDGLIANCQVSIGTTAMMVSEAGGRFPPSQSSFYLYVADAHGSTRRALDAGGTLVMEVGDMPYGDRQSGIADPSGNIWWISQRLVEQPYS